MTKTASPTEPIIEFRGVRKAFTPPRSWTEALADRLLGKADEEARAGASNVVLDQFSCKIEAGSLTLVHGRNGIGKSVWARCVTGLMPIDGGVIKVGGTEYGPYTSSLDRRFSRSEAIKHNIDYVPQSIPRPRGVSGMELLLLGADVQGWRIDRKALTSRANEVAESIGARVALHRRLADYSMPELQVLYLIRAALRRARLLVLDEPTAMLGVEAAKQIGTMLERLRAEGAAIAVIAHPTQGLRELGLPAKGGCQVVEFTREGFVTPERHSADLGLTEPTSRLVETDIPWRTKRVTIGNGRCKVVLRPSSVAAIIGPPSRAFTLAAHKTISQLLGRTRPDDGDSRGLEVQYLPFQAREYWLVPSLTLLDNCLLAHLNLDGTAAPWRTAAGVVSKSSARHILVEPITSALGIEPSEPRTRVAALSGGNRQRLLVARHLHRETDIFVGCDVDYGLDREGIRAVGRLLETRVARGLSVLLFSTTRELPEALANEVIDLSIDFSEEHADREVDYDS